MAKAKFVRGTGTKVFIGLLVLAGVLLLLVGITSGWDGVWADGFGLAFIFAGCGVWALAGKVVPR